MHHSAFEPEPSDLLCVCSWCFFVFLQHLHRSTSSCNENKKLSSTRATANPAEHMQQTHKQKQNKYCTTVSANCCMSYQLWQATAWPPFPWTYAEMQIWFGPTIVYIVLCGSIDLSSHSVSRNRATKNFGFRPEHHRRLTHTQTQNTHIKKKTYSTYRTHLPFAYLAIFGEHCPQQQKHKPKHWADGILDLDRGSRYRQDRKTQGAPLK